MKSAHILFLLGLVAAAHGGVFIQDGQEYEYQTSITSSAGTMDHATHTSGENFRMTVRMQVHGNTLNVELSSISNTQFVGKHEPTSNPFANTNYKQIPETITFSIELTDDHLFKRVSMSPELTYFERNIVRGWASQLQINSPKVQAQEKAFKSTEQTIHGECDVEYTVTDDTIYKSVAHMKDCRNRRYRLIDDWRGYRCDMDWKNPQRRENTDGLFSHSTTAYKFESSGGEGIVITSMMTTGSLMAQMFETAGVSHFAYANVTSVLVNKRASPGDISASGYNTDSLAYEFADNEFKWNKNRELKAREPFFSSGEFFEADQNTLKAGLLKGLNTQAELLKSQASTDPQLIQKAHQEGINSLYPILYAMDYDSLRSAAEQLFKDKSDEGVTKANMLGELLGAAGTTSSALVVRDLIMENKFDNDRDAARALTGVAFHIRRPNTQLVKEFEQLLNFNGERFVKMAIPLSFGHLVRITCERAGNIGDEAQKECFRTLASQHVNHYWAKYKQANNRDDKIEALHVLMNIRFGGIAKLLKPLIYGEMSGETAEMRSTAIWAAGWDAMVHGGIDYFMPIFANQKDDHEVRISALSMIFHSKPSSTDMLRVLAVLKTEKDYEVVNYAYALLERYATSLDPCNDETGETARYFLKYMKQFSKYETDWGFGVSKTFQRQFDKKKYGYTGSYTYYTIGSHTSTTPLLVGMGISNTMFHSYSNHMLGFHLRIEGLAKGLIRKFKTMDLNTWKTADLENILSSQMGIRERPDQPVRVAAMVMVKGAVVMSRSYDESSTEEGGKIAEFFKGLSELGDTYSINHQRAVQVGSMLYEQPSVIGLPVAYINSITTAASIQATVKRGNHRGLIFRNVKYDITLFSQGVNGMLVQNPGLKVTYGIYQDRIYHAHVPRTLTIGVNPIRKELKLTVSRPEYDNPLSFLMHSQTVVVARGTSLKGEVPSLKQHCPSCEQRVIVSKGPHATRRREFLDHECEKMGSYSHGEYFDCEMDIAKSNTVGRLLMAFAPYNKNPKTPFTFLSMGVRQITAFLTFFPRAEKCGVFARWSQSRTSPVKEIDISIRANMEENGQRLFFRGRKWLIRAIVKAKGQPSTRAYRVSVSYEFTPGYINNKLKIQVNRAPVSELGIKPYTVCLSYDNRYPEFHKEFLAVDMNSEMKVSGKGRVQYGEGTECSEGDGDVSMTFLHKTTQEARDALKNKWYYQECMSQKRSSAWRGRTGDKLPASEPCYMTMWDATNARHYTWNVKFDKLTNRLSNIISKARTIIKAGMLPYWDVDPDELQTDEKTGPFTNLEVIFKEDDKVLDVLMETSQGINKFSDYPLKFDWSKRLRNLKFTSTLKRLMDAKIINPCVTTAETVRTNDNVTYSYNSGSCWNLNSAHCGPNPSYAVFTKNVGGSTPLIAKAYFGGHLIEMTPRGGDITVSINGSPVNVGNNREYSHTVNNVDIFKVFKWGSTVNVYSFLRVWVAFDGNFVEVVPAPSVKGQHCGLCGNYNRNKFDEWTGKDGKTIMPSASAMVNEWKWQC